MKVENSSITYPGNNPNFLSWSPSNPVLHALLLAAVTTILSYQVTALFFDVLLGYKKSGQVSVSDLITMRLAEDANPLAIFANMLRNRRAMRFRMHRLNGLCLEGSERSTVEPAHHQRARPTVVTKFIVLVIVAPLANLTTVILGLERDSDLSFRQANFGGIALGIGRVQDRPPIRELVMTHSCRLHSMKLRRGESPLTDFFTCRHYSSNNHTFEDGSKGVLRLSRNLHREGMPFESILAQASAKLVEEEDAVYADLQSGGKAYRLRPLLSSADGEVLFKAGMGHLLRRCDCSTGPLRVVEGSNSAGWSISQNITCATCEQVIVTEAVQLMTRDITLVESDRFDVFELPNEVLLGEVASSAEFSRGFDLLLLRRRQGIVTFTEVCLAALVVVMLRIVLRMFVCNDVHIAVELLLKQRLDVPCCDSLLQRNRRLYFGGEVVRACEERKDRKGEQDFREQDSDSYDNTGSSDFDSVFPNASRFREGQTMAVSNLYTVE